MQGPVFQRLSDDRLHMVHGPIDLIVIAEGDRETAFAAAEARFTNILTELVAELPRLRGVAGDRPLVGSVACRMAVAVRPHSVFVTPMAAVAGAVADEILATMTRAAVLTRAAVNNGGDIALHLAPGREFVLAIASASNCEFGRVTLHAEDAIRGVATSGRLGRSYSLGIADSVTVLARDAAGADAAATLIANAVDLPGHPAIERQPANQLSPDSDLGSRLVTTGVGPLTVAESAGALECGERAAEAMMRDGLIQAAALFLNGQSRLIGPKIKRIAALPPLRKAAHSPHPA